MLTKCYRTSLLFSLAFLDGKGCLMSIRDFSEIILGTVFGVAYVCSFLVECHLCRYTCESDVNLIGKGYLLGILVEL